MWEEIDTTGGDSVALGNGVRVTCDSSTGDVAVARDVAPVERFEGWGRPVAVALSADESEIFVATATGRILATSTVAPDVEGARLIADRLKVSDMCVSPTDGKIYALQGSRRFAQFPTRPGPFARASVIRIDPEVDAAPVRLPIVASGLSGITVNSAGTVVVNNRAGSITQYFVDGTSTRLAMPGPATWGRSAVIDNVLVVANATKPSVTSIDLTTGETRSTPTQGIVRDIASSDQTMFIVTANGIFAMAIDELSPALPLLSGVTGPMYRGGYVRVAFDPGSSGITRDEIELVVAEGAEFAGVSASNDQVSDGSFLLLAGPYPGRYTLEARRISDSSVVAAAPFDVVDHWNDVDGPSQAYTGRSVLYGDGETWGSAWSAIFPWSFQFGASPISGTRSVAIVLVNTSDVAIANGTEQAYRDAFIDGVTLTDGRRVSVADYWREISGGQLNLTLAGVANVTLSKAWSSYHDVFSVTDRRFGPRNELLSDAVWNAQADVDLRTVDFVVMVVPSPNAGMPTAPGADRQFVWPQASGGQYLISGFGPFPMLFWWWWKSLAWVTMPAEWEVVDGRRIFATLAHEIGHNLGLGDMYGDPRSVQGWDLMDTESALPALSLPHRVAAGWTSPASVRRYNFILEPIVDEEIWLTSANLLAGGPSANEWAGVIVEVADGWRYYFEYRSAQDGPGTVQLADQGLAEDRQIVGYDVVAGSYTPPVDRSRPILLLNDDGDGDGPVLAVGEDYEELDGTAHSTFRLELLEANDSAAKIRVRYQPVPAPVPPWPNGPDPSIRPWPGGNNWQSPDIRIENPLSDLIARNLPSAQQGIPWAGHNNRVVATVRNNGNMPAPGVRVGFWVKDFTVSSAGPETFLGWDTQDVAVNAAVDFAVTWTPPRRGAPVISVVDGHYCIVARIQPYSNPADPRIGEVTQSNNEAQTNFTLVFATASSPLTRPRIPVSITNPLTDRTVQARLEVTQTEEAWRTYVEHRTVRLAPGETRTIEVMFECLLHHPGFPDLPEHKIMTTPNIVAILGLIDDPSSDAPQVIGGTTVHVIPGRATRFEGLDVGVTGASGRVVLVETGVPVADGSVLVVGRAADGVELSATAEVVGDGRFRVRDFGLNDLARPIEVEVAYMNTAGISPIVARVQLP